MEHYTMCNDLVARCGIMHHSMCLLDNRFCGRIFVVNRPGFTFSQYLDMMFPSAMMRKHAISLLDEVPEIDISMAEKREFTAQGMSSPLRPMMMQMMKNMGGEEMMSGIGMNGMDGKMMDGMRSGMKGDKRSSWNMSGSDSVATARMCAQECEGKTMRQLSRLWRYAGGARPMGDGVSMMNGVGLGVDMMEGNMMNGDMNGRLMDAKVMEVKKVNGKMDGGKRASKHGVM